MSDDQNVHPVGSDEARHEPEAIEGGEAVKAITDEAASLDADDGLNPEGKGERPDEYYDEQFPGLDPADVNKPAAVARWLNRS